MPEDKTLSKRQRRRATKKAWKLEQKKKLQNREQDSDINESNELNVEIEYISQEPTELLESEEFSSIKAKFKTPEELTKLREQIQVKIEDISESSSDAQAFQSAQQKIDEHVESDEILSNKQKKRIKRLTIAELKQLVERPDVVETHDPNSSDPRLLVHLKSYRNTVPIPQHWSQKRKYLQGKRGIEKPPFALPQFIIDTGISEIRDAQLHMDSAKIARNKARERMMPKLGRMDIDYHILHDAFFKFQVKPKLSIHGDIYFEGKENEIQLRDKKPGHLSQQLRRALGMKFDITPPPWIINVQRYGPPPSYPSLKIPGLNAPIPSGATYGYGEGQWGKIPVDENNQPIYGDAFGTQTEVDDEQLQPVDKTRWGMITEEAEEVEEEEEEEKEEPEEGAEQAEETSEISEGITSVMRGVQTPSTVELRKKGTETPNTQEQLQLRKELYTVLEEKESNVGSAYFGSSRVYNLPGTKRGVSGEGIAERAGDVGKPDYVKKQLLTQDINIALEPEELEVLDDHALKRKYQEQLNREQEAAGKEDISDIYAEQQAPTRKKRKT